MLFSIFFVFCYSEVHNITKKGQEIIDDEFKKLEEVEKALNKTMKLVMELIEKNEGEVDEKTLVTYEKIINSLSSKASEILDSYPFFPSSSIYKIPLILTSYTVNGKSVSALNADTNFNKNGYFIQRQGDEFIYEPLTKNPDPHGIIMKVNSTDPSCPRDAFSFTFYSGSKFLTSTEVNLHNKHEDFNVNIQDAYCFDKLVVKIASKDHPGTHCAPDFYLYSFDSGEEEDH